MQMYICIEVLLYVIVFNVRAVCYRAYMVNITLAGFITYLMVSLHGFFPRFFPNTRLNQCYLLQPSLLRLYGGVSNMGLALDVHDV